MDFIRKATNDDVSRIAEIFVFNNRMNYFPIFKDEDYSFKTLQVMTVCKSYLSSKQLENTYVYDDGIIRGFIEIQDSEIKRLYVDPFFQNKGIGAELITYAVNTQNAKFLWALEKNTKALKFYQSHGFLKTDMRILEEGTTEYLIQLKKITK